MKDLDFIQDIQYRQMQILAEDYKTEIMWCDVRLVLAIFALTNGSCPKDRTIEQFVSAGG